MDRSPGVQKNCTIIWEENNPVAVNLLFEQIDLQLHKLNLSAPAGGKLLDKHHKQKGYPAGNHLFHTQKTTSLKQPIGKC